MIVQSWHFTNKITYFFFGSRIIQIYRHAIFLTLTIFDTIFSVYIAIYILDHTMKTSLYTDNKTSNSYSRVANRGAYAEQR